MFSLKIIGMDKVAKGIVNLPKQMRFASAMALSRTAKDVRIGLLKHTRTLFTIRKNWLSSGRYSIRMQPAKRDDKPQYALVYSEAPWMIDHEKGGRRNLRRSKPIWLYARSGKRMTRINQRATFAFKTDKTPYPMEFGRIGKRIVPTVVYKTAVVIKADWGFEKTGLEIAHRIYLGHYDTAVKFALETAFR